MSIKSFPGCAHTRHRLLPAPAPRVVRRLLAAAAVAAVAALAAYLLSGHPIVLAVVIGAAMGAVVALGSTPVSDDELLAVATAVEVRGRHALVPPSDTATTLIPQVTA